MNKSTTLIMIILLSCGISYSIEITDHTGDSGYVLDQFLLSSDYYEFSIFDIKMINEYVGGLDVEGGLLFYTNDGGQTWTEIASGTSSTVKNDYMFDIVDSTHILTINDDLTIAKLNHNGVKWELIEGGEIIKGLNCVDSITCFAWKGNSVFKSLNSGDTWIQYSTPSSIEYCEFLNQDMGIYFGRMDQVIYKTIDGGQNWEALKFIYTPGYTIDELTGALDFAEVAYSSTNNLQLWIASIDEYWGVFDHYIIMQTIDGGDHWEILYLPEGRNREDYVCGLALISTSTAYALHQKGLLLKTVDSGENWSEITTLPVYGEGRDGYYDMTFVSEQIGWVVGDNARIFKTIDGGQNWIDQSGNFKCYVIDIGDKYTISGTVINGETSAPIENAEVLIMVNNPKFEYPLSNSIETDAQGDYSFTDVPQGKVNISVGNLPETHCDTQSYIIESLVENRTINFESNLPASISGTITDLQIIPVPGINVDVIAGWGESVTDSAGDYYLPKVNSYYEHIYLSYQGIDPDLGSRVDYFKGYELPEMDPGDNLTDVDMVWPFDNTISVSGTIYDSANDPITFGELYLEDVSQDITCRWKGNEQGSFLFRGLPTGTYSVSYNRDFSDRDTPLSCTAATINYTKGTPITQNIVVQTN